MTCWYHKQAKAHPHKCLRNIFPSKQFFRRKIFRKNFESKNFPKKFGSGKLSEKILGRKISQKNFGSGKMSKKILGPEKFFNKNLYVKKIGRKNFFGRKFSRKSYVGVRLLIRGVNCHPSVTSRVVTQWCGSIQYAFIHYIFYVSDLTNAKHMQ